MQRLLFKFTLKMILSHLLLYLVIYSCIYIRHALLLTLLGKIMI